MQKAPQKKMQHSAITPNLSIIEGLTAHSLNYLVQPVLSIDEFESKISDVRCIVVGFYCSDADPARDLSSFIDRSRLPILDTEVSPAPTPDGFYVVWVELYRNSKFPETLLTLLDEVNNLTNVKTWQFQTSAHTDPVNLTQKNIENLVELDQTQIKDQTVSSEQTDHKNPKELKEFFKAAEVDQVMIDSNSISLISNNTILNFHIKSAIDADQPLLNETQQSRQLQNIFGNQYVVHGLLENMFIVEHNDSYVILESIA